MLVCSMALSRAQEILPQTVGSWPGLQSFAISEDEQTLLLIIREGGNHKFVETRQTPNGWSTPTPIETLNQATGGSPTVGGLKLSYNGERLLFHAALPDSKGGTDLYLCEKQNGHWGSPINLGAPVNTAADEQYGCMSAGLNRLFFARGVAGSTFKKPNDTPDCQTLMVAVRDTKNQWSTPTQLLDMINRGCAQSPSLAIDGQTLLFAAIDPDNDKTGFDIWFTKEIMEDVWYLPTVVTETTSKETDFAPQTAGKQLYFIRQVIKKKEAINTLMKLALPTAALPSPIRPIKGNITALPGHTPQEATLSVFNPTTLEALGTYHSNASTGTFELPLLSGRNYLVEVRQPGFSFASFTIDLRDTSANTAPRHIELFKQIELELSVFDNEIFRPLKADVTIADAALPSQTIAPQTRQEGRYAFTLPLGREYVVAAQCPGFESNSFRFNLTGDVVFEEFKRNMPLVPLKHPFEVFICDAQTRQPVPADLKIQNLSREESFRIPAAEVIDGRIQLHLRHNDRYEFTVQGVQGYSFFNRVVDLSRENIFNLTAELISLREEAAIRLNNILFGTNSSVLAAESFPELDRVIQLLRDNPGMKIEIAAHTDNVGNAAFNILLSDRRAQSVVSYLTDNGIAPDRLIAKGYGLSVPLVPNTSDANRAQNRRVEFKIIGLNH